MIPRSSFRCYCNKEITFSRQEERNLLDGFEIFCSQKCLLQYISNAVVSPPKLTRNPPKVNCDFDFYDPKTKQFFRSLYEVWFARFLNQHSIQFIYEAHAFSLSGRYYTPDFYLPEKELYIECKGLWKESSKKKIRELSKSAHIILLPSYFQKLLKKYRLKDDLVK
jgi:hypothetical protein